MTISSGSLWGARFDGLLRWGRATALVGVVGAGGLVAGGCGGGSASAGGTTTPVKAKNEGAKSSVPTKKEPPPVEAEAIVKVRQNMFPPVDVGDWVCEPKSWNDKGEVLLHCTAPAGAGELLPALKEMPEVASAELTK